MPDKIQLQIKRQSGPNGEPIWEEFEVPHYPGMNVITALQEIQKNPVSKGGKPTTSVAWDAACLEEVCGSCTMVVNGKVRQACSALVDQLDQPIRLEPMTKFPIVRDLAVDRTRMFSALKKLRAWVPIDGTYDLGEGPKISDEVQQKAYVMSTCMTCGCCLEVCPQVTLTSNFVGAAAINQARLFNSHPTGAMAKGPRLDALMEPGGVSDCGNAQNCVQACPKKIPLSESIAEMGRQVTVHAFKKIFRG